MSSLALLWVYSKRLTVTTVLIVAVLFCLQPKLFVDRFINPQAVSWLVASDGWQALDRLTDGRLKAYLVAAELAVDYPMGVGLGNYKAYSSGSVGYFYSRYGSTLALDDVVASSAHNLYLSVASEAGMLPVILLILFTIWYLGRTKRQFSSYSPSSRIFLIFGGVILAQFVTSWFEVEIFWSIKRAFPFWLSLVGLAYVLACPPAAAHVTENAPECSSSLL